MPPAVAKTRARLPARAKLGPRILAAMAAGASVDDIATAERLSPKRVERLLGAELQRRWVAPAYDYARLQIARLEGMITKLTVQASAGDLASIDRLLRIMDRLDRYHGFSKPTVAATEDYEIIHQKLMAKINNAVGRLPAPSRDNS